MKLKMLDFLEIAKVLEKYGDEENNKWFKKRYYFASNLIKQVIKMENVHLKISMNPKAITQSDIYEILASL